MYSLVVFNTTELCDQHQDLTVEICITPQKPCILSQSPASSRLLQGLDNRLSILSVEVPVLDISREWSRQNMWPLMSGFFHIVTHSVFKVHTCCDMCQCFISLCDWTVPHCPETPSFLVRWSVHGHAGSSSFLADTNHAAGNSQAEVSV